MTALIATLSALLLTGCAPDPRYASCTNDAQCRDYGDYRYCMKSRCVECVGNSSCKHGKVCRDGACAANQ